MDLSLITARLKAQVAALQNRVYGAAELAVVMENPERLTLPCACIVWTGDAPLDQSVIPGQQARFREEFSVVIAVNNTVEGRGETAVASVEALAGSVQDALVGWAPSASHLPCAYLGSAHGDMDASALIHEFRFGAVLPGGSIFSASFAFDVRLLPAQTLANFTSAAQTLLNTHVGASTRLTSDYLLDREAIPESATRYQLQTAIASVDETVSSNVSYLELSVRVTVLHHLAPSDTERTYSETTLPGILDALLVPANWRLDGVVDSVTINPNLSLDGDVSREG